MHIFHIHSANEISRTVPHKSTALSGLEDVPVRIRCMPTSFTMRQGGSWQDSIVGIVLRLLQTGHDQKFYYQ